MLTLKKVNAEITKFFPGYEVVKGDGYFYVCGPNTELWHQTMIYVYRLNMLTLPQWRADVAHLINANKDR